MAQISVLNGLASDERGDLRATYPVNLVPVPYENELSRGYLRPAEGIVEQTASTPPGVDHGCHVWNGVLYRVLGGYLCSVASDGTITQIAPVTTGLEVAQFAHSPTQMAVVTAVGSAYLLTGGTLAQITDIDLGDVIDVIFVDGYFMFTDGVFLIITELTDASSIDALKYGSAEQDPDEIPAVLKARNEPVAVGRYTLEFFSNVGGGGFPFQRIDGALVTKGAIGTFACCVHHAPEGDLIAMVGSGKDEPVSVYLAAGAQCARVSTPEIDTLLQGYTEADLAALCSVESRIERGHEWLYVHLPDRTIVYDGIASKTSGEPVWFVLTSEQAADTYSRYQARSLAWCYGQWNVADPTSARIGTLTRESGEHYAVKVWWGFDTRLLHNNGKGAMLNELELIALTGRVAVSADPIISTTHSTDGLTWSAERQIYSGRRGQRNKRLVWRQLGVWRTIRIQRFRGDSQSFLSFLRLEVTAEPLAF